jgi:hypothetical protein
MRRIIFLTLAVMLFIDVPFSTACPYIPGDLNDSGVANGTDVVYAVNFLRGDEPIFFDCNPPCTGLPDPFYAALDVNGDCVANGIDITYMIRYFKGGPALRFCPTCPPD